MREKPARYARRILFLVALSLYLAKKEVLRSLVRVLAKSFSRIMSFLHYWATKCLQKGKTFGLLIYLNYNMTVVLTLLLLIAFASAFQPYTKITHNIDDNAKCLDGSSPALYLHEADPKNILFYLEGGGVCGSNSLSETLESCYSRSKTHYGSSLYWPQTTFAEGILSTDPSNNIFANWTKVILLYCDGAFHQGNTKAPYSYKDAKLYFRGSLNTRSHFQYIHNRYNLSTAQRVVLSGSSAGGIAALAWSNYLKAFIPNAEFRIIADSAVLLRIDIDELSNIFKISNVDEVVPNNACFTHYGKAQEWRCLTFEGILSFVSTETLFLQSAYDSFIISQRLYLSCLSEGEYGYSLYRCSQQERQLIEEYREEYLQYIGHILSYGHDIWSIDCSMHSFVNFDHYYSSPNLKVPMTLGRTMEETIYAWMFEGKEVVEIDLDGWPNNTPCSQ